MCPERSATSDASRVRQAQQSARTRMPTGSMRGLIKCGLQRHRSDIPSLTPNRNEHFAMNTPTQKMASMFGARRPRSAITPTLAARFVLASSQPPRPLCSLLSPRAAVRAQLITRCLLRARRNGDDGCQFVEAAVRAVHFDNVTDGSNLRAGRVCQQRPARRNFMRACAARDIRRRPRRRSMWLHTSTKEWTYAELRSRRRVRSDLSSDFSAFFRRSRGVGANPESQERQAENQFRNADFGSRVRAGI
jgi:hypothetical protein